ncbi:hypothetical protein FRB90_010888, partial [Tulasnella sp. 427]
MTAFESRGSIWPPEHRVWKPVVVDEESPFNSPEVFDPASHGVSRTTSKVEEDYEIDEVFLTSQGMDNLLRATTKDNEAVEDYLEEEDVFDDLDDPSRGHGSPKKKRTAQSPVKLQQTSPIKGSYESSEIEKPVSSYGTTASNLSHPSSGLSAMLSSGRESSHSGWISAASIRAGSASDSEEVTMPVIREIPGFVQRPAKEEREPRSSFSPVLGQQQLSGEASYSTENSSSQPPVKKRKVDHVGLGVKGITWPESLGTIQSPPSSSYRGTLGSPSNADTRLRSSTSFTYPILPPTATEVLNDIVESGFKEVLHRDPYYSNLKD